MSTPIIHLNNVGYRYPHVTGAEALALSGIDLRIEEGEFVGLVGANGSGKSTLARLLNGLLLPTAGEVRVGGLATADAANLDNIRETVGMVFQNPDSQIVATSVEDDIAFGPENLGLPADEVEARVEEAARRFGIERLRQSEPHWLSGGQKQRTVLAGVVALRPRVLVLDEPTSMLDPRSQRRFREFIDELWRGGTTIIYITQLMEEIATAPRLVVMAGGRIAFDGVPAEFFPYRDLLDATGLEPPLAARLAAGLAARGCQVRPALTLPELVANVRAGCQT